MKIVIRESQYKFLVEQTTPSTTPVPAATTPTTTTPPATGPKPMFGTPEQRVAAKDKRNAQRKKNEDIFVKNAIIKNFYKVIDDATYNRGVQEEANGPTDYYDKDVVYRVMPDDGTKVKVSLKDYRKYLEKQDKKPDTRFNNPGSNHSGGYLKSPCKGGVCTGLNPE